MEFGHYRFENIPECNMCGHPSAKNKVLGVRLNTTQGFKPKSKTGVAVTILRCKKCMLVYANPVPIPDDIQAHYGMPPEEYWASQNLESNQLYYGREIEKAKELLGFRQGMKALDIGAGLGKGMVALSAAGFDVDGFEPSIPFRDRAIENVKIDPEKLKLGTIEDLEYPQAYYDLITFGGVLEHLSDPNGSLRKALTWLKKGGVIHIEVPSSEWLIPKLINFYYSLVGVNYVTNLSPMHSPFHMYEFSLKSFIENSRGNGYEIGFYEYNVCDLMHIPTIFHIPLRWYMGKVNAGMQLTIYLRKK